MKKIVKTKEINQLKELLKTQCSEGNWDYDPYFQGMANGMILALAVIENKEPEFLEAPKKWGKDA